MLSSLRSDGQSSTEYFKPGLYMDLLVAHKITGSGKGCSQVLFVFKTRSGREKASRTKRRRADRKGVALQCILAGWVQQGRWFLLMHTWIRCKTRAPGCQGALGRVGEHQETGEELGKERIGAQGGLGQQLKASRDLSEVQDSCGQCQPHPVQAQVRPVLLVSHENPSAAEGTGCKAFHSSLFHF